MRWRKSKAVPDEPTPRVPASEEAPADQATTVDDPQTGDPQTGDLQTGDLQTGEPSATGDSTRPDDLDSTLARTHILHRLNDDADQTEEQGKLIQQALNHDEPAGEPGPAVGPDDGLDDADEPVAPAGAVDSEAGAVDTEAGADTDEDMTDAPADAGRQVEFEEPSAETHSSGPLYLNYSATSHVGKIRKNNQDSGYASGNLLVVADGMGGAAAGDLASAVAIEAIGKVDRRVAGEEMLSVLSEAIRKANDKIADLVADDHALEGMGTTVSGVLFDGSQLGLAHIGDSRAYLYRDGELDRITHDHSWVQSLIDDGKITEEEAAYHPHRSLLLRVLNGQPVNDPDLTMIKIRAGDRLLFCSDGLCGFVDDEVIATHLADTDRDSALDKLLAEALDAGGLDNCTIIIADVVDTEPAEMAAPLVLGAATEVDIPTLFVAPRVIDLGDNDDTPERDDRPAAPAPQPSTADEEDRYAPVKAPRWRWFRRVVGLCAVLLVLGGLAVTGVLWGRTQFFVGVDGDQVAIYQGLPDAVPLIPLSRVYEVQQISVVDLAPYLQDQVRDNAMRGSLDETRRSVATLRSNAVQCKKQRESPTPNPSISGTPARGPSPSRSASATRSTSGTPARVPSPSRSASATSSPRPSGPASGGPDGSC